MLGLHAHTLMQVASQLAGTALTFTIGQQTNKQLCKCTIKKKKSNLSPKARGQLSFLCHSQPPMYFCSTRSLSLSASAASFIYFFFILLPLPR